MVCPAGAWPFCPAAAACCSRISRGSQPCGELLERLAGDGFASSVVVEVNTRRAADRAEREADLAEALAFTRLHLVATATPVG